MKKGFEPHLSQPLQYAACRGNLEVMRKLFEKFECDPECKNAHGIAPLHCACYCGCLNVVEHLIKKVKCDPRVQDVDGACPLVYTAMSAANDASPKPLSKDVNPCVDHMKVIRFLILTCDYETCSQPLWLIRLIMLCWYNEIQFLSSKFHLEVKPEFSSKPIQYVRL